MVIILKQFNKTHGNSKSEACVIHNIYSIRQFKDGAKLFQKFIFPSYFTRIIRNRESVLVLIKILQNLCKLHLIALAVVANSPKDIIYIYAMLGFTPVITYSVHLTPF